MLRPLRMLITAGSTREPIDPVRFIGNRSSGKLGAALVEAALAAGHSVTLVAGPMAATISAADKFNRIDVETAAQMHTAVLSEFPSHDILIMAAAVADFRPIRMSESKLTRDGPLTIECEPTADIVAAACRTKAVHQFVVAFSLEAEGNVQRAREKMRRKSADLMVFNALNTIGSDSITATLLSPGHSDEWLGEADKSAFARLLIDCLPSRMENAQSL